MIWYIIAAAAAAAAAVLSLAGMLAAKREAAQSARRLDETQRQLAQLTDEVRQQQIKVLAAVGAVGEASDRAQRRSDELTAQRFDSLLAQSGRQSEAIERTLSDRLSQVDKRLEGSSVQSEQKLENIRQTVERQLTQLQEQNSQKLEQMRQTVDEKLQSTLNERLNQSFSQVSQRLEQVYKGLGEMQTLASGVGDLKRVLSNVKTRGILGEIQLGAILEQVLSPDQYAANVKPNPNSSAVVEYAVKLPGDGEQPVLLPIDAKFPGDLYSALMDAYDSADADSIASCSAALERRIKQEARDIRDKYICPPYTTDFAIMFLPVEGLYAEVVRRGLLETLNRDYRVNIAGPTTMAALLNSLQMGFRTLAIQKRSSEVWDVLGAVKTEFSRFSDILLSARKKLQNADNDLDKLIGVRTRAIERRLRSVTALPSDEAGELLSLSDPDGGGQVE